MLSEVAWICRWSDKNGKYTPDSAAEKKKETGMPLPRRKQASEKCMMMRFHDAAPSMDPADRQEPGLQQKNLWVTSDDRAELQPGPRLHSQFRYLSGSLLAAG